MPPFIATLESEEEKFLNHGSKDDAGCSYCGGNYFYSQIITVGYGRKMIKS